jgi:hypothetical protein
MQGFLFGMVFVHEAIDFWTMGIRLCTNHTDWKKTRIAKNLNLDYVLNLPLNEFKLGLLIALNYILCKLIYVKKSYIRSIKI